ncbi:MAG: ribulose-phosphate 3-epimerase [Planctomycetota bacterium]
MAPTPLDLTAPLTRPLVDPSILSADFGHMARDAQRVLDLGADLLHFDVMDGHFAPNLTMGADMIRGVRRSLPNAFIDTHLMVERPQDYLEPFAKAGANHFSFHVEVCRPHRPEGIDGHTFIRQIHELGMTAGIVINPPTPVQHLKPYLDAVDLVLIMSVNPGFSGQAFMPEMLDKARWVSEVVNRHTRVQMDGGLDPETAPKAVAAGVDTIVAASAIFGSDDPKAVIESFHACPLP